MQQLPKKRSRLTTEKIDKIIFLNKNLAYLKPCYASSQKESSEEMVPPSFISSKRALPIGSPQSYSKTKKRRQSTDNEVISSEQVRLNDDKGEDIF